LWYSRTVKNLIDKRIIGNTIVVFAYRIIQISLRITGCRIETGPFVAGYTKSNSTFGRINSIVDKLICPESSVRISGNNCFGITQSEPALPLERAGNIFCSKIEFVTIAFQGSYVYDEAIDSRSGVYRC